MQHPRLSPALLPSGIRIYDDENFDIVAEYDFDGVNGASFVGDVIVTRTAAYFTDSVTLKIYMVRERERKRSHVLRTIDGRDFFVTD